MPKFVIVLALVALALACGSNEAIPDVVNETGPAPTTVSDNQRLLEPTTQPAVPTGSATTDASPALPAEPQAADSVQVGDGSDNSEYSDVAALRDQVRGEPMPASEDGGMTKGMNQGWTQASTEGSVSAAGVRHEGGLGYEPPVAGVPNDEKLPLMFFEGHGVNPFVDTDEDALSTFALDGDTGSFQVGRLYLDEGHMPPPDSVRVEEWVNSFEQGYDRPGQGLGISLDGMMSPFGEPGYRLLRVGITSARPEGPRNSV